MNIPGKTPDKTLGKTAGKKTSTAAGLFIDLLSKTYDLGASSCNVASYSADIFASTADSSKIFCRHFQLVAAENG